MKRILAGTVLALAFIATLHAKYSPELIGGKPVDKDKDFDAVVYSAMGSSRCSSTIVGPRVLFIAAHCVSNGGTATFKTKTGTQYSGVCTHSPNYARNSTADWAFCKLDKDVTGVTFETVETRDVPLKAGDKPLLCGYGCVQPGGGGGNDGTLRVGRAVVKDVLSGSSNDVVTEGDAALCYGDSGGPFFCTVGDSMTARTLCGVNSRGNIQDTSYLSALFTPMAKSFIQDWKTKNGVKICGYDQIPGCRGSNPVPSDFTVESKSVSLKAVVQPDAGFSSDEAKLMLQSAIDSLEVQ